MIDDIDRKVHTRESKTNGGEKVMYSYRYIVLSLGIHGVRSV